MTYKFQLSNKLVMPAHKFPIRVANRNLMQTVVKNKDELSYEGFCARTFLLTGLLARQPGSCSPVYGQQGCCTYVLTSHPSI